MRPVQHFSDEYLEQCRGFTPEQMLAFLEEFRLLQLARMKQDGSAGGDLCDSRADGADAER